MSVSSKWCMSCSSQIYDTQKSEFRQNGTLTDLKELPMIQFQGGNWLTVNGSTQIDQVCMGACTTDYEFFYVMSNGAHLIGDGVLGLTPDPMMSHLSFG